MGDNDIDGKLFRVWLEKKIKNVENEKDYLEGKERIFDFLGYIDYPVKKKDIIDIIKEMLRSKKIKFKKAKSENNRKWADSLLGEINALRLTYKYIEIIEGEIDEQRPRF